jgi:outer membrane protein OmpU
MKKVLFATTALVASAGFAAADVSLSGSAEMGIFGGSGNDLADDFGFEEADTQFHTDISVTFTLSGETDNGLTFGASIGLEEAQDGVATTVEDDFSVFISGGPWALTMGDTDGAFDRAMSEVPVGGDIVDAVENAGAGYDGNGGLDGFYDGQILRADYAFDAFEVSFSVELCDDCDDILNESEDVADFSGDPVYGLGASYEFGDFEFGVGYQWVSWALDGDSGAFTLGYDVDADIYIAGISGAYSMGDITVGANYSFGEADLDFSGAGSPDDIAFDYTHFGLGAAYSMDAWTFAANWGMKEIDDGTDERDSTGYGLAIHYDLGGGAVVQFGYGWSDNEGVPAVSDFNDPSVDLSDLALGEFDDDLDTTSHQFSFGVAMSF